MSESKNPLAAFFLNFLIWGLGYLYVGERVRVGWVLLILEFTLLGLVYNLLNFVFGVSFRFPSIILLTVGLILASDAYRLAKRKSSQQISTLVQPELRHILSIAAGVTFFTFIMAILSFLRPEDRMVQIFLVLGVPTVSGFIAGLSSQGKVDDGAKLGGITGFLNPIALMFTIGFVSQPSGGGLGVLSLLSYTLITGLIGGVISAFLIDRRNQRRKTRFQPTDAQVF